MYTYQVKKFYSFIVAVAIAGIVLIVFVFFVTKDPSIKNLPAKNSTIVAFGDSLVVGVGSTKDNDLVSLLSSRTGTSIINLGVSGNTTAEGLARIDKVIEKDPGIVVLLLGGNDYLRKVPIETTFQNLSTIIDKLHEQGIAVLLLGVRGGLLSDHFGDSFKKLAKEKEVGYVSDVLAGLVTHREYMSDSIHPNDIGYAKIADRVAPVLQKMIESK